MGVDIGVCKNLEKIADYKDYNEDIDYDYLDSVSDGYYVIIPLRDKKAVSPYSNGIYKCNPGKLHVHFSYGGYSYFLDKLENIGEENNFPFTETRNYFGIDNCISYTIAEDILKEFEENKEKVMEIFSNEEYEYEKHGYLNIIEILKECIECKGIIEFS